MFDHVSSCSELVINVVKEAGIADTIEMGEVTSYSHETEAHQTCQKMKYVPFWILAP